MYDPMEAFDQHLVCAFNKAAGIAMESAERENATYAVCTLHCPPPGPDMMVVMPLTRIDGDVTFTAHALAQADGRFYPLDIPGPH